MAADHRPPGATLHDRQDMNGWQDCQQWQAWLAAPMASLWLPWPDPGAQGNAPPGWRPNQATQQLLAQGLLRPQDLDALAAAGAPGGHLAWQPAGATAPWQVWSSPLPDAVVLWLQPPPATSPEPVPEPLDVHDLPEAADLSPTGILSLARDLGRVGLFMRDIDSGKGWWDARVFDIMGLPPAAAAPSVDQVLASRVHPDDRQTFRQQNDEHKRRAGRGDIRLRIVRDDGQVRHLHSIFEVLAATVRRPALMIGVLIDDTDAARVLWAHRELTGNLRLALQMAGVSVWRIDPSLRFLRCEPPADTLPDGDAPAAAGPGDLSLEPLHGPVHPQDQPALLAAVQQAQTTGRVVEVVSRHGDDATGWRSKLSRRVRYTDAEGRPQGLLGVSIDITALAEARALGARLADRVQLAAETVGLGFWSMDADSGERHWDTSLFRLYHLDPSAPMPGVHDFLQHFVHANDRQRLQQHVQHHQRAWSAADTVVFRVQTAGQATPRWIQARSRRGLQQGRRMTWGVHVDVTDLHLAQTALEQERQRAAFALASAGVGVWERRLDGGPSYLSPQAKRLRGLDEDSPGSAEQWVAGACDPQQLQLAMDAMQRHIDQGTPYRIEFPVRWPDGSEHWLASFGQLVRDDEGRPRMVAGINVDVTARRQAEQLAQEKRALEDANQARSEFLSRMSHELRTPLNAVLGFAQLMQQDASAPLLPRQQHQLQRIAAAGQQLLVMVEGMLDEGRRAMPVPPPGAASAPAPVDAAPRAPAGRTRRLRLLCVEDNPVNAVLLRELLEMRPAVQHLICADAGSTLAAAAEFAADAFLLDLQLPDLPGTELMQRLRAEPRHAQARFIALSANAMPAAMQAALDAGFDAYWTKPIDVRAFLGELDAMVHALRQRQVGSGD